MNPEEEKIKLKCPHDDCNYVWDTSVTDKLMVTCPSCQRNIKVKENRVKING